MKDYNQIIVTTGDLRQDYEIIGPVYFQVSNKGLFKSALSELINKYRTEIDNMKSNGQLSKERPDWGFLYLEWSVGQNDFDKAFYVSTQELKKRAALLGADAVICMRQDIDLDTNGFTYFYLQMYGTAVRYIRDENTLTGEEKEIDEEYAARIDQHSRYWDEQRFQRHEYFR